ncbi:hypothetical protein SAMN06265795_101663 [Noviherbaspirillum humi]|uniref:Glycosyltransferase 2-like domain-containing protein n=2 Tax=Noviherbaspirillum humi TaxID=1688639 RepID=A0A239CVH9_9BURK|nr:hypothetical protein SAMN06265795_101663 [Noviherbaspirillum humi]
MLIDNSPERDLESVAANYHAEYIHQPRNPGFAAAHNLAIRRAIEEGSTYHLVLNPDIHFGEEVVPAMLAFMEANPDVGLVMPDIRYPDGQRQFLCKLLPTPVDLFMRRFLPRWYAASGRLARYELRHAGYDSVMEVPSLSGCFMLIRTEVLRRTGGFDERYFMYLEDVDLCRRIGQLARTVYFPGVSVVHEYTKSSYRSLKPMLYHMHSAMQYFNKWGWLLDSDRTAVNKKTLNQLACGRQVDNKPSR